MLIESAKYSSTSVYDLLQAAARGRVGIDQRLIRSIIERGQAAVPDLLRFASEDHEDDPVQLEEELISIFHYLKAPEALPFYVETIRLSPEEVTDELVAALHAQGGAAVEPLLNLYHELGEEEGGEVAFVLASLGVRDDRVRTVLEERLQYDLADAAFCLGLYGDPAARPALERELASLKADDPEEAALRRDIMDAINQLEHPPAEAIEEPLDLLSMYPEEAGPQIELFSEAERLELLESSSVAYRREAAASFFGQELTEKQRKALLQRAKTDSEPSVRARCWEALETAADQPAVRRELLQRFQAPDTTPEERAGIAIALSSKAGEPEIRAGVLALYELPETRAKALETMWRSLDQGFRDYFPRHLEDADQEIKQQALWGIGYLGIGSEAGRIEKLFEHEELRADALFAYALSVPAEISRGRIKGLFQRIESLAKGLSEVEEALVQVALDERLAMHGFDPVFSPAGDDKPEDAPQQAGKVGRNDPCPCGSGQKYKKCCGR